MEEHLNLDDCAYLSALLRRLIENNTSYGLGMERCKEVLSKIETLQQVLRTVKILGDEEVIRRDEFGLTTDD
jgi:hypothetical protein